MAKKYKFEIIRYDEGDVKAYRLGNNTLVKHYYWNNNYEWLILHNPNPWAVHFNCEVTRGVMNGTIEYAYSCRTGKQRLIELFEEETQ